MLMPATASTAPTLTDVDPLYEKPAPSSFSQSTNLAGNPSLTIRAGFSTLGLPVGLQLIGHCRRDRDILATASVVEDSMSLIDQRPLLF